MSQKVLHGENAITPINKLPKNLQWHTESLAIIGHSETGHHHVLEATKESSYEVAELDNKIYLRLNQPAKIVHKKAFDVHETVTLDPGTYVVTRKTEYDPFAQIRRNVYD